MIFPRKPEFVWDFLTLPRLMNDYDRSNLQMGQIFAGRCARGLDSQLTCFGQLCKFGSSLFQHCYVLQNHLQCKFLCIYTCILYNHVYIQFALSLCFSIQHINIRIHLLVTLTISEVQQRESSPNTRLVSEMIVI